jgi:hypothetical protein
MGRQGKPLAKGKFWELSTAATKPPGVTLVDGEMYKEITEPRRNHKKVT